MTRFSDGAYPTAGIGIEYKMRGVASGKLTSDPIIRKLSAGRLEPFDYLELQPPHFIFRPELYDMVCNAPILIHVSQLSLGSIGIPMDGEFLKLTRRLLDLTGSPWVSEHIAWSRFQGGDTRHFVLPFLGDEVADTIVGNARRLSEVMGLPILLENAPRKLALKVKGEHSESQFIKDVLERSRAGFLLDIDSAMETSQALEYDLWKYLRSLPLQKVIELHVGDPVKQWKVLRYLLESGPVRAVTVDSDFLRRAKGTEVRATIDRIRPLMKGVPERWNKPVGRAGSSGKKGEPRETDEQASSGRERPEETELRVSETATFRFRAGKAFVQESEGGASLEFPLRLLPVIEHFSDWKPAFSAFMLPEGETRRSETFALLRELMQNRILVAKGKGSQEASETWSRWGPSLTYYLASRTHSDEPYLTSEESESLLGEKAKTRPQPSGFKDYAAHPFYPLEDPFTTSEAPGERGDFLSVLLGRRTARSFSAQRLTKEQLSKLLYFTWGHTAASKNSMGEDVFLKKTSPSGGSLHGAEVYPILMNVEGMERGVYHYSVRRHGLELLSREDPRTWMSKACGGQDWISEAAAVFLSTSVVYRTAWKYDSARALRVILHDVGHLSQTFCLVATWLGLGSFTTAALRDEVFEKKIRLDYMEEPVLLLNGAANLRETEKGSERPPQGQLRGRGKTRKVQRSAGATQVLSRGNAPAG